MKKTYKANERGTLLVEALAMLGLIAMVTPTLYKKSAERMQEIQDINAASQARTMSNSITAFISAQRSQLFPIMSSNATIEIAYEDSSTSSSGLPVYAIGYSSYLPYGFSPNEIRNFGEPKVYLHKDSQFVTAFILYPKETDIGRKRSARLASLVGAAGGVVVPGQEVQGTGGGWYLDSSQISDMGIDEELLTENSLMVTTEEPVSLSSDDNDKYLYRVPDDLSGSDDTNYYHNTMVTNLYMGGYSEGTDYADNALEYYSIYNVRKLAINTDCTNQKIRDGSTTTCPDGIADLYIGKPFVKAGHGTFEEVTNGLVTGGANRGAAWIYGNLSALSDTFKLFRADSHGSSDTELSGYDSSDADRLGNGYDVLRFARLEDNDDSQSVEVNVLRATTEKDSAVVAMLDDFVRVGEGLGGSAVDSAGVTSSTVGFMVGRAGLEGEDGALIHAYGHPGGGNMVLINKAGVNSDTYINLAGGTVHINGSDDGSSDLVQAETYINEQGGFLTVGKDGDWMYAESTDANARVHILQNAAGTSSAAFGGSFIVGAQDSKNWVEGTDMGAHMIFANDDVTSLRGGNIRAYKTDKYTPTSDGGAPTIDGAAASVVSGTTVLASRYSDILGATYMGSDAMIDNGVTADDGAYTREDYRLGVAGSAWIDGLLWARQTWFLDPGMKNLHAGFNGLNEYKDNMHAARLNVYEDKVAILNRDSTRTGSSAANYNDNDVMFYVDNDRVRMQDLKGAGAEFTDGSAIVGTNNNYFFADGGSSSSGSAGVGSANVVGNVLANVYTTESGSAGVVDIQREAMRFSGHWDAATNYENAIDAKAGTFTIKTKDTSSLAGAESGVESAQFLANEDEVRIRYANFVSENDAGEYKLRVQPNLDASSTTDSANVQIDGSFHVTGNEVIHIANNVIHRAGADSSETRAMFEVDPEYVQVWAKKGNNFGAAGPGTTADYRAMLKINPSDIEGGSSTVDDVDNASIYIRKGAIELEESLPSPGANGYAADEGYGYLKANRLVSNTGLEVPALGDATVGIQYDTYMVNPAYTSVMHDIKLTSRGGVRLSDVLPDYVLKGVYTVANDRVEGSDNFGSFLDRGVTGFGSWASPYLGRIPYAKCPPGYRNLATVIPVSFMMTQVGDIIPASQVGKSGGQASGWVVNQVSRQGAILNEAEGKGLIYPSMEKVSGFTFEGTVLDGTNHPFSSLVTEHVEGWYLGLPAVNDVTGSTLADLRQISGAGGTNATLNIGIHEYSEDASAGNFKVVASPLYFTQNNWLKTTLEPADNGWDAYMGFIYNPSEWGGLAGGHPANLVSNYNDKGYNDSSGGGPASLGSGYVWNLFPVPTNSLEGHATVYCYFDRSLLSSEWDNLVEKYDQLHDYKAPGVRDDTNYIERLNDPSLKYTSPW